MAERKLKVRGQRGGEATQLGFCGDPEKPSYREVVVGPSSWLLTCKLLPSLPVVEILQISY